jgi:hypothetical protein
MHMQRSSSGIQRSSGLRWGATHPRRVLCRSAAAAVSTDKAGAVALPTDVASMTAQAAAAIAAASADGVNRHLVTLINPVNEKAVRFTSTEATDYPTSNMTEVRMGGVFGPL